MKIYRLKGRAEQWAGCGMLPINSAFVDTNQTTLKKMAARVVDKLTEQNKAFKIDLERLEIKSFTAMVAMQALKKEDSDELIETKTLVQSWEGKHDAELHQQRLEEKRKCEKSDQS
jgi:hypothetical protein